MELSIGWGIISSVLMTLSSTYLFFDYKNHVKRRKIRTLVFTELLGLMNSLDQQLDIINSKKEYLDSDEEIDEEKIIESLFRGKHIFPVLDNFIEEIDFLTEYELHIITKIYSLMQQRERAIEEGYHTLEVEEDILEELETHVDAFIGNKGKEESKVVSWNRIDSIFGRGSEMSFEEMQEMKINKLDNN